MPTSTHPCNLHTEFATRYVGLLLQSKVTRPPRAPVPIICTSVVIPRVTFFCKRIEQSWLWITPLLLPFAPISLLPEGKRETAGERGRSRVGWLDHFYAEHLLSAAGINSIPSPCPKAAESYQDSLEEAFQLLAGRQQFRGVHFAGDTPLRLAVIHHQALERKQPKTQEVGIPCGSSLLLVDLN